MNLASEGGDPTSGVYFVDFNQDCTSLAVGLKNGFKIFQLNEVDKYEPTLESTEGEDICIVERLFSSSLLVVVSLSSPRRLRICHYKRGGEICSHNYSNTILSLKLNRVRIVVCLEESLYIHDIKTMRMLHTIRDTPPNPRGLCALSADEHYCYLAYPGSSTIGEVQVFDAVNLKAKIMIPAHNNPLAAMTFNFEGTMIATASIKGTVIRVFCVTTGDKLFEFRRGMKRCVDICSLSFSLKSDFLCASSNTETVHIFKLVEESSDEKLSEEPEGWISKFLNTSRNYLPAQVTEMLNQERSFATVHLPFSGLKNICALTVIQKIPRVVVASADGYLYIYNLNMEEGGACTLARQHRLDGYKESHSEATVQSVSTGNSSNCSIPQISPQNSEEKLCHLPKYSVQPDSFSLEEQEEKVQTSNVSSSSPCNMFRLQDDNEFPPVTHKAE